MNTMEYIVSGMNELNAKHNRMDALMEAYMEEAESTYRLNCAKSELKILQESGTIEHLLMFEAEAGKGLVASVKATLEKITEAFIQFCTDVKDKFLAKITSAETTDTVEKIKQKTKFNPFIGKKKVEVADEKKQLAAVSWAQAQYKKLIAKIKAGKNVEHEEIDEVEEQYRAMLKKAGFAAMVVIPVMAALTIVESYGKSMKTKIDDQKKITTDIIKELKSMDYDSIADTAAANSRYIGSKVSSLGRETVNFLMELWTKTLSGIRGAVASVKGGTKDTVTESAKGEEEPETDEDGEGEDGEDVPKKKKSAKKRKKCEDDEETTEESAYSYLESLEREIFGDDDEYTSESTYSDDDDDEAYHTESDYLSDLLGIE